MEFLHFLVQKQEEHWLSKLELLRKNAMNAMT